MGLPTVISTVQVTDEHRAEALNQFDASHGDSDRGRTQQDNVESAKVGTLGEILAREAIIGTDDLELEYSENSKWDNYVNDYKVEIKTRKTWNYSKPDLLVRKKFDLAADFYLQIDLHTENDEEMKNDLSNVVYGEIAGFVTQDDVDKHGEPFLAHEKNKKNKTVLIQRRLLRPFHEFHARVC